MTGQGDVGRGALDAGMTGRGPEDGTPSTASRPSPSGLVSRLRNLDYRNEALALAGMAVVVALLPGRVPASVAALGVVGGAAMALQAIGIVLVYRSDRFINFAQVSIGGLAASGFSASVNYQPAVRWLHNVCPPCAERVTPTLFWVNYWLSLLVGIGVSMGVAWLVYVTIIRRFKGAPRLIVTVASIFLDRLLVGLGGALFNLLTTADQREHPLVQSRTAFPIHWNLHVGGLILHTEDVLFVAAAVAAGVGLFVYLRRSATGTAIRASSENPQRAETLGVNVAKVTSRVWLLAGLLSGTAAVLSSMAPAAGTAGSLGPPGLVRVLLVAVLARFVSLPMVVVGSVAVGVLQAGVQASFSGSSVVFDGLVVVMIAVLLLVQRPRRSRVDVDDQGAWQATRELRPIPQELRSLPVVRKWVGTTAVVLGVVVVAYPWLMSPAQTNLAAVAMLFAMIGLSLLILTGWAGQISLGQFGFAAIGAYLAAWSRLPFPLAVLFGALGGAVVAVAIGIPALKLRGLHLAVVTLALAVAISSILLNPRYLGSHLPSSLKRPALLGIRFDDQRTYYYFTLLVLCAVVAGVVGLRRSRTGRVLIAARENEAAVQSFGVSIVRVRLSAFALSGFIAALAGALYAYHQYGVRVSAFPAEMSITLFLMTIIGGLGSVTAPLIGAAYQGALLVGALSPQLVAALSGSLGLILLLFMPGGLAQVVWNVRDAMLRRIAERNHIVVPSLFEDRSASGRARARLAPKLRRGGGEVFVPARYEVPGQWALPEVPPDDADRRAGFTGGDAADAALEEVAVAR